MHRLILKHAAEAGAEPDSYMIEVLEQHLEDLHDVALAEAATARIKSGESKLISSQEMWGDMDD
ncbi:hypothetical protein BJF93_05260 [Xaviernesmea oryzae]|uniref:CopG family transcriptional regulator n=2 Tax=Xaviernesmea oryzae TaxID=464029 RepID=A0A1Q9ASR5_9HYPH|nr:hypothetical protein BJF93_05260 [Xaviernesmea oryzae]